MTSRLIEIVAFSGINYVITCLESQNVNSVSQVGYMVFDTSIDVMYSKLIMNTNYAFKCSRITYSTASESIYIYFEEWSLILA